MDAAQRVTIIYSHNPSGSLVTVFFRNQRRDLANCCARTSEQGDTKADGKLPSLLSGLADRACHAQCLKMKGLDHKLWIQNFLDIRCGDRYGESAPFRTES